MLNKVLIINTGGTIGMVHSEKNNPYSPLRPATSWEEVASEHPILNRFETDYIALPKLVDSSDFVPENWIELLYLIKENYNKYLGFVILHGTDTMAFTASALSFMCKNLSKPIILTGSQVPLQSSRSDALQNLITSITIAGNEFYGVSLVPEVSIFFRDTLLRGNRSRKLDASNYFGFASPNFSPLGEVGGDIRIIKDRVLKKSKKPFEIDPVMNRNVLVIELFPGLQPHFIKKMVESNPEIKGIILKTFGNGNAPTGKEFLDVIKSITEKGIIVVDTTQCIKGFVKMGLYEASAKLVDAGVISGADLTPESAITKLMYLLGKELSPEEIKKQMQLDIAGEQTVNQYDFSFEVENKLEDNFSFKIDIPKNIDKEDIVKSVLRITNLNLAEEKGFEERGLELNISLKGDRSSETFHRTHHTKKVLKTAKNLKEDIHLSFNSAVKSIVKESESIFIHFSASEKVEWEKVVFSIFTEKNNS